MQDKNLDNLIKECQDEKKKKGILDKLHIFGPNIDECTAKNEAQYLAKKRRRKIKRMIAFGVFCAIIATIMILALLAETVFSETSWVGTQARHMLNVLRNGFSVEDGIEPPPAFIRTFVLVTLGYIAVTSLHFIINLFATGSNKRRKTIVTLVASLIKYVGYLVIIIFLFNIWQLDPTILAAIITALGVAIGFGAQGVISDLLTGIFLIFENSLQVGDIITVESFRGTVEEIGIRTTKFTSVTGDVKVINNSELKKFINMSMHRV